MPHTFKKLTPNLVVADVERSIAFYRDLLGFTVETTVPEQAPYVFAILRSGVVEIFVNSKEAAFEEYPALMREPLGGTLTLYLEVADAHESHALLKDRAKVVMPFEKKWYGVTEFAIADPDGWVITLAQRE